MTTPYVVPSPTPGGTAPPRVVALAAPEGDPLATLERASLPNANRLLLAWQHRLGPCRRPFGKECYVLRVGSRPVSLAISASVVSATVAGYRRRQVVELARLCSAPGCQWASRVMLRLWREVAAPRWSYWPVLAAVSYSLNAHHKGSLYRFDGWQRIDTGAAGSRGGGTWTSRRADDDPRLRAEDTLALAVPEQR